MKKLISALIVLVCIVALSSCTKTFDGYYHNLDLARGETDCYDGSDYVFTEQAEGVNLDFVIKGDSIHIVVLLVKGEGENAKYKVKSTSAFLLNERISNEYDWNISSKLDAAAYQWCIVPKEAHTENGIENFEFVYKDTTYCLCYEFPTK
ncbi:MAG: hypothetical protein J6B09_05275 [Clostridia bacterium]|nr:hypothetical protein [Clostridia bacterium]